MTHASVNLDPAVVTDAEFHAPGAVIGYRKNGAPIRLIAGGSQEGMSEEEILALPAAVPLVTAGKALLMGRTKAHELARRDEFPCRVLKLGGSYVVTKAELLRVLGLHQDTQPAEQAAVPS